MKSLILFIARGFGSGLAPVAPGTFGSLVGFLWLAGLLSFGSLTGVWIGTIAGILFSCWICGAAEKILNTHDPSSVVLDEIIAIPVCFLPWLTMLVCYYHQPLPTVAELFSTHWKLCLTAFAGFRFFDIRKPTPVFQLQKLPGGIGVTMDDVMAGLYTSIVVTGIALILR